MTAGEIRSHLRGMVWQVLLQSRTWENDRRNAALLALLPDPSDLLQRKLLWEEVARLGRGLKAEPKQWELFGSDRN